MINLLPPRYQQELRQEENQRLILILGTLFLIFLISVTLILFSVKLYIQGQLESVNILLDLEEKTLQTSGIQDLRERIDSVNQNLSKLNAFYEKQISSISMLEKVFKTLPPEIYLTAFSWQKNTSQVAISGLSPNREILFLFQKNLEESKEFSGIELPTQNWIKPVDIDFRVTFKIAK